jgi:hypothetical protein
LQGSLAVARLMAVIPVQLRFIINRRSFVGVSKFVEVSVMAW